MNRNYKLILTALLLTLVAALLVACGGEATPPAAGVATTESARSAPVNTLKGGKIGQPVSQGDYILTINAAEKTDKVMHDKITVPLSSGKIFVNLDLTVTSNGDLAFSNPSYVKIKDAKGGLYDTLLLGKTPALPIETSLPKGSEKRGWVTLEVPQDATGLSFQYKPQSLSNIVISIPLEDNAVVETVAAATTTSAVTTKAATTAAATSVAATTAAATTAATTKAVVATTAASVATTAPASANSLEFKELVSKEGGFSILLPGTPQQDKQNAGDDANPMYLYYYSAKVSQNLLYFASFIDYSDEIVKNRQPEDILKNVQNGSVSRADTNKLVSEKTLTVAGLPAREYEYSDANQISYLTRAFLSGKRLYQIGVVYAAGFKPNSSDVDKFFNSLKLSSPPSTPATAASSATIAPVKLDGYIFTINKLEKPATIVVLSSPSKPKAGSRYVTLDVTIASEKAEDVDANTLYASIIDGAGNKYNAGLIGRDPELPTQNDIPAGQQVRGWITFEIPTTATNLTFVYSPISVNDTVIKIPLGE